MTSLRVDEVDQTERAFLVEVIKQILHLSYASCCQEAIIKSIYCEGCIMQHPSQKEHQCLIDEEEAWNLYYDEAIQIVDSKRVWHLIENVANMLEIKIHSSWFSYIPELFKLPWTTAYLFFLQIDNFSERTSPLKQVLEALSNGPLKINRRKKPLTKTSTIDCPYEFTRKDNERMDVHLSDKFSKLCKIEANKCEINKSNYVY